MEPNQKPARHRGLILEAGMFVALVATFLGANYLYGRHVPATANLASPSPAATALAGRRQVTTTPSPAASPSATPAPEPFVVPELDVVFVAPTGVTGLEAVVVRPAGQAAGVTTVGFSTTGLTAMGCPASVGALGYLSNGSSDTPGEMAVGRVTSPTYYYRPPSGNCREADSARIAAELKKALTGLKPTSAE